MKDIGITFVFLCFLALPGFIGFKIYLSLTRQRIRKDWEDLMAIFVLSILSYVLASSVFQLMNYLFDRELARVGDFFTTLRDIEEKKYSPNLAETICAVVCSFVLGAIMAFGHNNSWINRIGKKLKLTKKYGDEDVWDFFHNRYNAEPWSIIRDHKINRIYLGAIAVFSESGMERELIMTNVTVFDDEAERLYDTDLLYLCRPKFELTIEVQKMDFLHEKDKFKTDKGSHDNVSKTK